MRHCVHVERAKVDPKVTAPATTEHRASTCSLTKTSDHQAGEEMESMLGSGGFLIVFTLDGSTIWITNHTISIDDR